MKPREKYLLLTILLLVSVFFFAHSQGSQKTDVDITKMSPTFVYAQVFNMLIDPDEYEGKIIRIKGDFYVLSHEEDNGEVKNSFSCIVQDATACCAQGLTFNLKGSYVYPDDYPAPGEEIIVQGRFHQFDAGGFTRIELVDSTLELVKSRS